MDFKKGLALLAFASQSAEGFQKTVKNKSSTVKISSATILNAQSQIADESEGRSICLNSNVARGKEYIQIEKKYPAFHNLYPQEKEVIGHCIMNAPQNIAEELYLKLPDMLSKSVPEIKKELQQYQEYLDQKKLENAISALIDLYNLGKNKKLQFIKSDENSNEPYDPLKGDWVI